MSKDDRAAKQAAKYGEAKAKHDRQVKEAKEVARIAQEKADEKLLKQMYRADRLRDKGVIQRKPKGK